jgi:hypothetical protein
MGYSLKKLWANFWKYFNSFYAYALQAIYWGSVPAIILYGLFSKPYSPLVLTAWDYITGKESSP